MITDMKISDEAIKIARQLMHDLRKADGAPHSAKLYLTGEWDGQSELRYVAFGVQAGLDARK